MPIDWSCVDSGDSREFRVEVQELCFSPRDSKLALSAPRGQGNIHATNTQLTMLRSTKGQCTFIEDCVKIIEKEYQCVSYILGHANPPRYVVSHACVQDFALPVELIKN